MADFDTAQYFARKEQESANEEVGLGLYQVPEAPPQGGIVGPVFRQSNLIVSTLSNRLTMFDNRSTIDPDFDFLQHIPQGHQRYAHIYSRARNIDDINATRWQIEDELRDKSLIGQKPVQSFFLGFIAQALDPSILFPASLAYKGVMAEYNSMQRALSYGAGAAVATGFSEIGLHSSQFTRELQESTLNVLSSAIIGSAVGVYAGKFKNSPQGRVAEQQTNDLLRLGYIEPPGVKPQPSGLGPSPKTTSEDITPPGGLVPYQEPRSKNVSAANVVEMAFPGNTLAMGERTAKLFDTTLAQLTPMNRLFTSPFYNARKASELLFENNYILTKNRSIQVETPTGESIEQGYQASAIPLETWIKADLGAADVLRFKYDELYFDYRGIKPDSTFKLERDYLFGQGATVEQFNLMVYENYRDATTSGVPQIDDAVNLTLKWMEDWYKKIVDIDKLPPGLERYTAERYIPRYYNHEWIKQNMDESYTKVRSYMKRINDSLAQDMPAIDLVIKNIKKYENELEKGLKISAEIKRLQSKKKTKIVIDKLTKLEKRQAKYNAELSQKNLDNAKAQLKKFPRDYFDSDGNLRKVFEDDDELHLAAENTLENILNLNDDRYSNQFLTQLGLTGKPKSLNQLVFLIPDEELGPMLVRDMPTIIKKYAKAIIPYYHITKMGQELGFEEGIQQGLLKDLLQEYRDMSQGVSQERAIELDNARKKAEKDIIAGFELLLGVYGAGSNMQSGKLAKTLQLFSMWNYTRMMGYMTISAITDPGAIILKNGFNAFVYEGLLPIIQHLEGAKHNKDLLASLNRSINIFTGQKIHSFLDQEGIANPTTGFEKMLNYFAGRMGNLSLMSSWTDLMQWCAGNISVNRTLKYVAEYVETGKIPEKELVRLNSLGLPEWMYKDIYGEFKRLEEMGAAGIDNGVYWMDFSKWDLNDSRNLKAYEYFKAILLRDLDSTIVNTGKGDKPLFANTIEGKTIFQFKTYGFGATNRLLISGLQRRDAEFYQGAMMSLFLGALGYVLTSLLKNRDMDLSAKNLAFEAIDRSGLLGVLMEVPLTLQKMGLLPGVGTTRYHSRDWTGAMFGPTLGTLSDIVTILNKIKNADETPLNTRDVEKMFSMAPWYKLWYIDGINKNLGIVEGVAESLGAEEA